MKDSFFRQLSADEEQLFRRWARQNWKPGQEINPVWHPVIRDEITKIQEETKQVTQVKRQLTEEQRTLISLSLGIAREQFQKDAKQAGLNSSLDRLRRAFEDQAAEALKLAELFESAETITLDFDPTSSDR
jgi:uncharacterized protein YukE